MHEDRSTGTSKDYHNVRARGPQRHYSILPHSGQYLGYSLPEASTTRNLTLDRVYAMLAEFLIELRLHEEQGKITQIVTGSSTSVKHSMYDWA